MNAKKLSNSILRPDVCRCCLSSSGTWDMTATYITNAGAKEVFANILHDCFGVSLSYMNDMEASHFVCDLCVTQLRDASNFHNQVIHADKRFSHNWTIKKDINQLHIQLEDNGSNESITEIFFDDLENASNPESRSSNETCILQQKAKKKLRKTRLKHKMVDNNEYNSEIPIARLIKKTVDERFVDKNYYISGQMKENTLNTCESKIDQDILGQSELNIKRNIKQISERQRIILTCKIVLIETTACPFRHHKSWFQCFFCAEDFMEIKTLRTHYSQVHADVDNELKKIKRYPRSLQIEISKLECRICNTALTDVETMVGHFIKDHDKIIYKECIADYKVNCSPYTCHLCDKEFHVFRTLTSHLNEHYINCICDVCGKSFLNSKRLKVHKRTHENGTYPCSACGKILKTKTSLSNHMESKHSKRVIKCQICFKPMKHYNARIKHMSEIHNITHKFKCPYCDRIYNIKHYLATHIRQTHGHKNKKCEVCNMAFITNHSLKKHMSKHTGEKPFTCTVCCKSYARSYTLREHNMRAHDNKR